MKELRKLINTNMGIEYKKVLIIGVHELTTLQIEEIRKVCENASLEFQNVVDAMGRMEMISLDETASVKEFIELASKTIYNPTIIPIKLKTSRYEKEQHKRAMRYHSRSY